MAFWVEEEPPVRGPGGFLWYFVKTQGFVFEFSSPVQLRHCCVVLGTRHMPTSLALSRARHPAAGPNQHWLSRLPADLKKWSVRQRIVADLARAQRAWEPL